MKIEQKLKEMGIELQPAVMPIANYVAVQAAGDLLFLSGAGPVRGGKATMTGKLGAEVSMEQGYAAAREGAYNLTCALKAYLGDLDRVEQIVKLTGYVASTVDFYAQPRVIDGASDFFGEVFGEKGRHARVAVGVPVLPLNTPVEVEIVVKVRPE